MGGSGELVLRGWIAPATTDRLIECEQELRSLGVDVGVWDAIEKEWQHCVVTPEAMKKLDPLWGEYVWGLE